MAVQTKEDFVCFLEAFRADYEGSGARWSNADIPSFFDAMVAWAGDMDGFYENRGETLSELSPWRVFADLLMAARTYE